MSNIKKKYGKRRNRNPYKIKKIGHVFDNGL